MVEPGAAATHVTPAAWHHDGRNDFCLPSSLVPSVSAVSAAAPVGARSVRARLVAMLAGLAGILLCALTPLLPVTQTTATVTWPQTAGPGGMVTDITAPLVSRCAAVPWTRRSPVRRSRHCPPPAVWSFSTIPPAGIDATRNGLFVRANADTVVVAFRIRLPPLLESRHRFGRLQHRSTLGGSGRCRRGLRRYRRRVGHAAAGEEAAGGGVFTDMRASPPKQACRRGSTST